MADEKKPGDVIHLQDAGDHGYWGYSPVEKDRDAPTVAGVTAAAAKESAVSDEDKATTDRPAAASADGTATRPAGRPAAANPSAYRTSKKESDK